MGLHLCVSAHAWVNYFSWSHKLRACTDHSPNATLKSWHASFRKKLDCVAIFQLGIPPQWEAAMLPIHQNEVSMSLCHHNISKNPSHYLALLSQPTTVAISPCVNQGMTISVRLWQLWIKAWKYKQSVNKSCGEDEFTDVPFITLFSNLIFALLV